MDLSIKNYIYHALLVASLLVTAFLKYEVSYLMSAVFVVLVFLPLLKKKDSSLFVLMVFLLIGRQLNNSFLHPRLMQFMVVFYTLVFHKQKSFSSSRVLLIVFYFILAYYILGDKSDYINSVFVTLSLGLMCTSKEHIAQIAWAFVVTSFVCSIYSYFTLKDFSIGYIDTKIAEDIFLHNPNVMGATIGLGVVAATMMLIGIINNLDKNQTIFVGITLFLSLLALAMVGSRGALFSSVGSSFLMFVSSPLRIGIKQKYIIYGAALLLLFYSLGFFDFFLYRLGDEGASNLSGRPEIWAMKLAYFNNLEVLFKLFGIGRDACTAIGDISSHNDFVTSLVGYGYIGLVLFIILIVYPLFHSKKSKMSILALSVYIIGECFVLEPVFRGYYSILFFYLFMYSYSIIEVEK